MREKCKSFTHVKENYFNRIIKLHSYRLYSPDLKAHVLIPVVSPEPSLRDDVLSDEDVETE